MKIQTIEVTRSPYGLFSFMVLGGQSDIQGVNSSWNGHTTPSNVPGFRIGAYKNSLVTTVKFCFCSNNKGDAAIVLTGLGNTLNIGSSSFDSITLVDNIASSNFGYVVWDHFLGTNTATNVVVAGNSGFSYIVNACGYSFTIINWYVADSGSFAIRSSSDVFLSTIHVLTTDARQINVCELTSGLNSRFRFHKVLFMFLRL